MSTNLALRPASDAAPATSRRILCVDDEPNVLSSLQLLLARDYEVHTATSGAEGLEMLTRLQAVPVVISDMRMPGMSGAEFLAKVGERSPSSVTVLLTGVNDIEAAAEVINKANLFRLLLKPCAPDEVRRTLTRAMEQHRLRSVEKDLLENTLIGSMRALTEVLSIADPVAFGRVPRLKELAMLTAARLAIWDTWPIEYATLVCQIGNISLPETTARKLYGGMALNAEEKVQVDAAARLAPGVIKHIPRLEEVARILSDLSSRRTGAGACIGAKILQAVLDYEALERTSKTRSIAIGMFQSRRRDYDPNCANALLEVLGADTQRVEKSGEVEIAQLRPGMVIAADFRSLSGALLVAQGTEITPSLLTKLLNFPRQQLPSTVNVRNP
ncbi:MAG: response regulator [Steroidobacteraceae bacterium]